MNAIFMNRCSWHQQERGRWSRRRLADPLSTSKMKRRIMQVHIVAVVISSFSQTCTWHRKGRPVASVTATSACFVLLDTSLFPGLCLAEMNCRAAEYSEYFEISIISRVSFFGTTSTPSCVHIFRCSDAAPGGLIRFAFFCRVRPWFSS